MLADKLGADNAENVKHTIFAFHDAQSVPNSTPQRMQPSVPNSKFAILCSVSIANFEFKGTLASY